MNENIRIIRVAVAAPVRRFFDYLAPVNGNTEDLQPGVRVSIPFGKQKRAIGVVITIENKTELTLDKLKYINRVLDKRPLFDKKHLQLMLWAGRYYHHPAGEVVFSALPTALRKTGTREIPDLHHWCLTTPGRKTDSDRIKHSPRQTQLLSHLKKTDAPISESEIAALYPGARRSLMSLEKKGFVKKYRLENTDQTITINKRPFKLNREQKNAVDKILAAADARSIYLLDGVTGSGKTEVYMSVIEPILKSGKQCLVLLPEIGLTPQLTQRFSDRFRINAALQHSGLSEAERLAHWQMARSGQAKLILGTRSAVWTPLANPGLYIIDEEHDLSYKQQDGFRYSARDVLIARAQRDQVSVILGSATPSLESLCNVKRNRYHHLKLPSRAGKSTLPEYRLLNLRGKKMYGVLSRELVDELQECLEKSEQVLLFLNRRGYAIHLYCHQCAWKAECPRCEYPYTFHKSKNHLNCHQCGGVKKTIAVCPKCRQPVQLMGHGTERIEEQLNALFPGASVARVDRDSTRKKGAMAALVERIHRGEIDILVGTQMLAKGHHFPNVTLTAIVDADRGLFSTDFRAGERLAQLFMQVSGRAGRGSKTGKVLVQTHTPEHPLFRTLINYGYDDFAAALLSERKSAALPPYTYMACLRAEAHNENDAKQFIQDAFIGLKKLSNDSLEMYGPVPALIEKRGGRYRYQLIIQSDTRKYLHKNLDNWLTELDSIKISKKVRWSLDIDPLDMS